MPEQVTKVMFLDFDGPMLPVKAWVFGKTEDDIEIFDALAVKTVKYIVEKANAKIVISSSWRLCGYDKIVEILETNGIDKDSLHDDWSIKDLVHQIVLQRDIEIKEWLSRHPEVTTYAVIDDAQLNVDNLVHVSSINGITFENQKELLRIFNLGFDFFI